MIKYNTELDNRLGIYDNIFINGNTITAYYILFPFNYKIMDRGSISSHIEAIRTGISQVYSSLGEVKISIFNLTNIVSKNEVARRIVQTAVLYDKSYKIPEEYKKYISSIREDFTILAVNIKNKDNIDFESDSAIKIAKDYVNNMMNTILSPSKVHYNIDKIKMQESKIRNTLQRYAIPASEKLVMNIYVNSVYPSYNLVYNNFMIENNEAILDSIKQEFIPHLGWFEMSNSGIVAFGADQRKTYGSVLTLLSMPDSIDTSSYNIAMTGMNLNMNLLDKNAALLKFKRHRAAAKEEVEDSEIAAKGGFVDKDSRKSLSLADAAVKDITAGVIMTELDANILVMADSKESLDKKKKNIISCMADARIVCSIAKDQAKAYVNSFVKHMPEAYRHSVDLEYALAFQMDRGSIVGDSGSKFMSPIIGYSLG